MAPTLPLLSRAALLLVCAATLRLGEATRCDKLTCQLKMAACSLSVYSYECQPFYDALVRSNCVSADAVPKAFCLTLSPKRSCRDLAVCQAITGARVLPHLVCGGTLVGKICCQEDTTGFDNCPVGRSGTKETACRERSVCTDQLSGSYDDTKVCGDGPEICCTWDYTP